LKKLLIVIKDNVELKNFLYYNFSEYINKNNYKVYLLTPVNNDSLFQSEMKKHLNSVVFLDAKIFAKVLLIDKVIYSVKRFIFFLINSQSSDSCFQKLILTFKYKGILTASDRMYSFIRIFLYPFSYIFKFSEPYLLSNKCFFSKSRYLENIKFDYVLFLRPDSMINAKIYNSIKNNYNLKVLTMIRSFDTPHLKGIFTIPSDITFSFSESITKLLKMVNKKSNYGKIINIKEGFLSESGINSHKNKNKNIKIMYATGSEKLDPKEYEKVNYIFKELRRRIKVNFKFYIKIHGNDFENNYSKLKDQPSVILLTFNNSQTQYMSYTGEKISFFDLESSSNHFNDLATYDLIMSSYSTINYDSFLVGTRSCFISLAGFSVYKNIYKREHIRELSGKFNIPIIKSIRDLMIYIERKA
jgi:hypothetical protein